MTLDELRKKHKADILRIAGQYGVTNIRVFGSVARGDAGPNSDLDLLVHVPKGIGLGFFECGQKLSDALGKEVELVTERSLHPYIRDNVLRDATPL